MPQLDEKKAVIILLLNSLRQLNPEIGNYEKSILNENFQYAVKLNNGRIILSSEIVQDFELSPKFVTEDRLRAAATEFIPSQQVLTPKIPANTVTKEIPHTQSYSTPVIKKNRSTLKGLLILTIIVVLALVGYFVYNQIDRQNHVTEIEDTKSRVRNNITDYVTAGTNQYKYSSLGGIYGLVISIKNTSDYMLENVKIRLTYIKANGEVWTNVDYDFEMLGPLSEGTIKVPDTNRGVSVKVRVVSVKSNALGL